MDFFGFNVISEAIWWRFRKQNNWLGLTILVTILISCAYAPIQMAGVVLQNTLYGHHSKVPLEQWTTLLILSPLSGFSVAFNWILSMNLLVQALNQVAGLKTSAGLIYSNIRTFWNLVVPAIFSQVLHALMGLCLVLCGMGVYCIWILLIVEILVGVPFAFVLILLIDRNLSVKEAVIESLRMFKEKPWTYFLTIGLINLVIYGASWGMHYAVPVGPILSLAFIAVFMPLPFIVTVLLYRQRYPEMVRPPVLDPQSMLKTD